MTPIVLAVFCSFLMLACSRTKEKDSELSNHQINAAEAIRLAAAAAERNGIHLSNYETPEAHYEFTKKDKSWSVFFEGKQRMPGNHFLVSVDAAGKTMIIRGK